MSEAKWITNETFRLLEPVNVFHKQYAGNGYEPDKALQNQHILFRKSFVCTENVSAARINITADDYYKLYVNGRLAGQGPAPGFSFKYYYNSIDITGYLKKGQNIIAVHTYYQGLINRVWVSGDNMHGLWLELEVNGNKEVVSDETFLTARHSAYSAMHKIGYDTQFAEYYDSNAPECGFYMPGFDDSNWQSASVRKFAPYKLLLQPTQMLDIYPAAPPEVTRYGNIIKADMKQCVVGLLSVKAQGIKDTEIEIHFADELNEDGTLKYAMRSNCLYIDKWKLSGAVDELVQFDYKAFRYAELILPDGCDIVKDSLKIVVRHYPYKDISGYRAADEKTESVVNLIKNTIKYGVQEVFFDCPQREKGQYLGDGYFIGTVHSLITGETAMLKKFLTNIADTAFICPGLMAHGPGAFMQEIADFSLQFPTMLLAYYALTKDLTFITEMLPVLKGLTDYFAQFEDKDGLLRCVDKWNLVDWPQNARDGYDADLSQDANNKERKVKHNVINAFYIGALKSVNKLLSLCGRPHAFNAKRYEDSYIKTFYDAESGLFKDSEISSHKSFHSNVLPLHFDIGINDSNKKAILRLIKQKRLDHCNIFGAFQAFCALKRAGEDDFIQELITDDKYWLNMIKEGATTTFEAWGKNLKWNTALFHLAFVFPFMFMEKWDIDYIFV